MGSIKPAAVEEVRAPPMADYDEIVRAAAIRDERYARACGCYAGVW